MKHLFVTLFMFFTLVNASAAGSSPVQDILLKLDAYIESGDKYVAEKEDRIHKLREELSKTSWQDYQLTYALFDEYKSYKFDSAYFYANNCLKLAQKSGSRDRLVQSHCAVAFCYLSSGLFHESFDEMSKVDVSGVDSEIKAQYYALANRLYYDASDFNNAENWSHEYTRKGTMYADSLMQIVPEEKYEYQFAVAQREIKHWHYDQCIELYQSILRNHDVSEHDKAIINSSIGGAYLALGQKDSSVVYLAKAAINDIVSATKETTALYRLAEMLCEQNDPHRAYIYINVALEDADFYNARHRKLSINPILPIIERARFEVVARQRNYMAIILILCVGIIALLVTMFIIYGKQRGKIERRNRQLKEANKIKEEYIGHSFYVNSEFITEFEELFSTINMKLAAHQYDDVRDMCKQSKVKKKRESMYDSFDKCFLKIFPSFISEYAKLFPEGYVDESADVLTNEMRIFALMRLGITDAEKVSKFMNYSVHTIYTYKTRAKNKSIVGNDEFEKRIKAFEIG